MSLGLAPHTPSRRNAPPPSPNRSPRSSTSSIPSAPPLTPLFELDGPPDDSALTSSGSSMSDQDESNADDEDEDHTPPGGVSGVKSVTASLAAFSFHPTSALPTSEGQGHAEIDQNFSFGTCPSTGAGTPIAERGPFEYPALSSPSTSPRASVYALGETYRRGSIVANSTSHHSSSFSEHRRPSHPSPPATRRSSTCSTITTLPTGGRRPSILHSATTGLGPAPPPLPLPPASTPDSPINLNNGLGGVGVSVSRRPSLAFPQKRMETPIPPSLMGRRGSLPAAQLFGLPHTGELTAKLGRASFAGQGQAGGGGYGYVFQEYLQPTHHKLQSYLPQIEKRIIVNSSKYLEGQGQTQTQGQGLKYESGLASPIYRQRLASGSFSSNSGRGSLLSGGSLSSSEEGDEEAESPGVDGQWRIEGVGMGGVGAGMSGGGGGDGGGGVGGKGTVEV
ncbi:hypothetical protein BCR39DRAFT_598740 [Naematelia encephala]|uniref:Uncharacterized protein n=1 Tax=Naematelia encephala TaxID=71784 RepID=A0A1Y2B3J6_9TREE|nr:hypothetical protein BCR39DRAFT_598740 [Naematelia encephala]